VYGWVKSRQWPPGTTVEQAVAAAMSDLYDVEPAATVAADPPAPSKKPKPSPYDENTVAAPTPRAPARARGKNAQAQETAQRFLDEFRASETETGDDDGDSEY
jgi:hypothetical protein